MKIILLAITIVLGLFVGMYSEYKTHWVDKVINKSVKPAQTNDNEYSFTISTNGYTPLDQSQILTIKKGFKTVWVGRYSMSFSNIIKDYEYTLPLIKEPVYLNCGYQSNSEFYTNYAAPNWLRDGEPTNNFDIYQKVIFVNSVMFNNGLVNTEWDYKITMGKKYIRFIIDKDVVGTYDETFSSRKNKRDYTIIVFDETDAKILLQRKDTNSQPYLFGKELDTFFKSDFKRIFKRF